MLPRLPSLTAALSALLVLSPFCGAQAVQSQSSSAQGVTAYSREHNYGQLSLMFEPNQGQSASVVKFLSRGSGYNLFLTQQSVVLSVPEENPTGMTNRGLAIEFVDSNPAATIVGLVEQSTKTNYLKGRDPSKWHRNIPNYSVVEYRGIYSGVDVRLYGNGHHFEHDFVVAPGADPRQIKLRIPGLGKSALTRGGDLNIETSAGRLTLKRPQIYQLSASGKRSIDGEYVIAGENVRISLGRYDKASTLVIDPILVYSTYIAGSKGEFGNALAVDSSGNAYLTGFTSSPDFPTQNPLQAACNNCTSSSQFSDVFISKLNSTGTGLVYSTFLGGSESDEALSIAVDSLGNAVVVGRTRSGDFPTVSPIQVLPAGSLFHAFVASLSADGSSLNYSTYLGGTSDDFATGVAIDSARSAYVTGLTQSPEFPVTPGTRPRPAPPSFPHMDVFVVKISAAGAQQYGVTIHGTAAESVFFGNNFSVNGIAVDPDGNAYITGSASAGWPTTAGSFQPVLLSAPVTQGTNAFVAKLKPDASDFVYSTYLGGSDTDVGKAIALDQNRNAYVTGDAASVNFPVTPGAFQTSTASCCRTFVSKLNASGSGLVYSSLLSGTESNFNSNQMIAFGIAVDGSGSAYAIGRTTSRTFPIVNPIQPHLPSENAQFPGPGVYVSKFNPTGSALLFSTYFGGSTGTEGRAVVVSPAGTGVYIAGTTFDTDLPTTSGAFQTEVVPPPQFTSASHAFVAKFDLSLPATAACIQPRQLVFFNQVVNTTSPTRSVTVTNCGSALLHVNQITVPPQFAHTTTCVAPVPPGGSCTISVRFTPPLAMGFSGVLEIADDAAISPQKISLQGFGVPVPAPRISVGAILLTLDQQLINTTSVPRDIPISNSGNADLHIVGVQISGPFSQSNTCSGAIPPNGSCLIRVTFTPTTAGYHTGTVTIIHDAAAAPSRVSLEGTGVSQHPVPSIVTVSPPAVPTGSPTITLRVRGQDFFQNSVVRLDGASLPTTYVDEHTLTAPINAAALLQMGERVITVFTPVPGGGTSAPALLTVYRKVNLAAADLAFDPVSGRLFASIPKTAPNFANSIVAIDPATGQILQTASMGANSDPSTLALSQNGQFLYVALRDAHSIRRLQLPSLVVSRDIPLGPSTLFGDLNARDIQVIPGSPLSMVVAKERQGTPSSDGVRVIDDNVARPVELTGGPSMHVDVAPNALAFTSDTSVVYMVGSSTLFRLGLSNTGVSILNTSQEEVSGGQLASDGSLLYTNTGKIFDPAGFALSPSRYIFLSPLPTFQASVIPERARGRTFFLTPTYNSFQFFNISVLTSILVYDQQTLGQVGSVDFPDVIDGGSLVRWGTDGFAFVTNSDVPVPAHNIILARSRLTNAGIGLGALSTNTIDITRGNTSSPVTFKVSVPASLAGSVDLSCLGLPLGATCNFAPGATVSPTPGSPISVSVTITVPRTAPAGFFNVSIQGASGSQVSTQVLQLTVKDYEQVMLTTERSAFPGQAVEFFGFLTDVNFYNFNVTLGCTAGATPAPEACSVSPSSGNPLIDTMFTVNATASQAQDYIFNVTGTGADANSTQRSQTLVLRAFDFSLGAFSQPSVTTIPGSISPPTTFLIQPIGPFSGSVTLDCNGLPAGASCSFNGVPAPFSVNVAENPVPVVLIISATQATPVGIHLLSIHATTPGRPAGPVMSPFQLSVTPAVGNTDLSVSVTGASTPVMVGEVTSLAVTATNNGASVTNATLMIAFAQPQRIQAAAIQGGLACSGVGAASVLLTCAVGGLENGATTTVTIELATRFVSAIRLSATATSEFTDTNLTDNFELFSERLVPRPLARRGLPLRRP